MSKYFRVDGELAVGAQVDADAHRFVHVLRAKVGQTYTLCDGRGALWQARVTALDPFALEVVAAAVAPDRNPSAELEVWLPLLKGGKADDLVRQLTELGVTRIVPYSSKHAVVRLDAARAAERQKRLQAIAAEAGNQCGRTRLPEVETPVDHLPRVGPGAFLWEGGGAPARDVLAGGVTRILVGPEGGLADDEAQHLSELGWVAATLGARILRAETAVVTFAVMALAASGEL